MSIEKTMAFSVLLFLFLLGAKEPEMETPIAPEMVEIVPRGKTASFSMGCDCLQADEKPVHGVNLTIPYAIGRYEVTNAQFSRVMNWALDKGYASLFEGDVWDSTKTFKYLGVENLTESFQRGLKIEGGKLVLMPVEVLKTKEKISSGNFPVQGVTWYGACAFCDFLSLMNGLDPAYNTTTWECDWGKSGYRLPTEAEWVYAARGDTSRRYPWGDEFKKNACTYGQSKKPFDNFLTPVGFFDGTVKYGTATASNASLFGVYDLSGNLWEWCGDWYGSTYFSVSPQHDPRGPQTGEARLPWSNNATKVWKGGGLLADTGYVRIDIRWSACCDQCYSETGFRVARMIK